MVSRLHYWRRFGLKLLVVGVMLSAVLVLLAKWLLPQLERYQPTIEQQLSAAMHAPVRIGRLRAYWVGLEPDITLEGLRIYHPQQAQTVLLEIPRIHIELALWQSLLHQDWRLDAQASGLSLHVAEQSTGEWVIEELIALGPSRPEVRQTAVNWLLKQADLQFGDMSVELHPYQQDVVHLSKLKLVNRNRSDHHDFRLTALLDQQPVKIFANLRAKQDFMHVESWQGQIYADIPSRPWQTWLKPERLPADLRINHLQLGGEFWLGLQHGKPISLTSRLDIPRFDLDYRQKSLQGKLKSQVSWQQQAGAWLTVIEQVDAELNRHTFKLPVMALEKDAQAITFSASELELQSLAQAIRQLPLPAVVQSWLTQAQPEGVIPRLMVKMQTTAEGWHLQDLAGEVKQLRLQSTPEYPGVKNLSGWFVHHPQGGEAGLDIENGELDLRQAYRVPTPVGQLHAKFSWRDLGDSWLLQSNNIAVANADANGHALVSLWVPKHDVSAAQMHLLASIYDGRLDSVWRYVPWPPAGDDTLAWLKGALVSGHIRQGDFLYEGVLIDRPGVPPSTMQMNFAVENGRLNYAEQWPELKQLNANISIYNRHLQVRADSAQIYQSIARNVVATIPELNHPTLAVNADVDSTGEDVMRLFQETTLKQDAGLVADLMDIKGEVAGALQLDIPLAANDNSGVKVNVTAELPGNPVVLKQANEFDLWLSGGLNYRTGYGLTSRPMPGFFLGQPVTVRLASILDRGDVKAIQIHANGQITPANLKPWLADLTQAMHGVTQYQAALTVPVADEPVHISLTSDLVGWNMDLPEPLGKKSETVFPMHYEMLLDTSREQTAYLMLGPHIQSAFGLKDGKVTRTLVQLGENWVGELPPEGMWIRGHLPKLDINSWLPWLRPQNSNTLSRNVGAAIPELQSFNVDIDQLIYGDYILRDARLGLEQENNSLWRLQLVSNDLSGEALLPHNRQLPVTLNIQTLNLPFERRNNSVGGLNMGNHNEWVIPRINLHIADLSLKPWTKLAHSQLDTVIAPSAKGIRVASLKLKNALFEVEGELDWQWRGVESTSYKGQINIRDIANLFSAFNRVPVLNSQNAKVEMAFNWAGSPADLTPVGLNGQLTIDMNKGRVLNLNRMVSLSRLLGLLDTDNFKRRLRFDFSDITQKGLAYDKIHFDAEIAKGVMRNHLAFHSPSLAAQGQGQVNLVTTDIDQYFDISVPISSAVPYAAAVVAGPVIGGALVAAEAMLDDPLTKMTTLHYQVKGKWQNPTVERLKKPMLPWRDWFKRKNQTKAKP